jgi:hypothetical protein
VTTLLPVTTLAVTTTSIAPTPSTVAETTLTTRRTPAVGHPRPDPRPPLHSFGLTG